MSPPTHSRPAWGRRPLALERAISSSLLNRLYHDPKTGYVGAYTLYKHAKAINPDITLKQVREWYKTQADIQQHAMQAQSYPQFKITSSNPNAWQIDLAFWKRSPILIGININSRIGYAKLLSDKKATTVDKALITFIKLHGMTSVVSDNGSEWMNKRVQALLTRENIHHYAGEPGDHTLLGKIDRFIRTIKARLTKINPKRLTQQLLNEVIVGYNTSYHTALKATPDEMKGQVIYDEVEHNQRIAKRVVEGIPPGSTVRYRLKPKTSFAKEGAKYSRAVYKVIGLDGLKMHIQSKNGHALYKAVNDIKLVEAAQTEAIDDTKGIHEAIKILDHKKLKNGRLRFLVQWADGDQTWEPQGNLRVFHKNKPSQLELNYIASHSEK
jgi:transposase InsO family protein